MSADFFSNVAMSIDLGTADSMHDVTEETAANNETSSGDGKGDRALQQSVTRVTELYNSLALTSSL